MQTHDAIVLGAGAAGLYCGGIAAARGLRVAVIDHARAPGEKIRISGGGRCNFTNVNSGPHAFLSENPHFAKSALARHGPDAFIDLIRRHGIAFHEKTLGQLFCDGSAKQVVALLVDELRGADLRLGAAATDIRLADDRFTIALSDGASVTAPNLIVATGGRSIAKMGASGFGYDLARRFGLGRHRNPPGAGAADLRPTRSGLDGAARRHRRPGKRSGKAQPASTGRCCSPIAACPVRRSCKSPATGARGSRSPCACCPTPPRCCETARAATPKRLLATVLADHLPARLAQALAAQLGASGPVASGPLDRWAARLAAFHLHPAGSEGYRTAEVTLGGVSTDDLDARTMQARRVPGLHFIGEVVDVTGWLGGYNFQWAWSSAHACATGLRPSG